MPQLMPLNWVFSSMMMLLVFMSVSLIYSDKEKMIKLNNSMQSSLNKMNFWCW